jgi:hypothetical protein
MCRRSNVGYTCSRAWWIRIKFRKQPITSAPLGVQIMLVERSRDALGVQIGSPRCADHARRAQLRRGRCTPRLRSVCRSCSSSAAETRSVYRLAPLGVQIMLVERSRDAVGVHNLTNSYLSLTTQNPPKNRQCRLLR